MLWFHRTIIQDLKVASNTFYAKIYSLVGVGLGISAIVSALIFDVSVSYCSVLIGSAWIFCGYSLLNLFCLQN